MSDRIADILDGLALFQDFSYPELKAISRYLTHVLRKQGGVLFEEGDPGYSTLILAEGRLSIFTGGEHGTQPPRHGRPSAPRPNAPGPGPRRRRVRRGGPPPLRPPRPRRWDRRASTGAPGAPGDTLAQA